MLCDLDYHDFDFVSIWILLGFQVGISIASRARDDYAKRNISQLKMVGGGKEEQLMRHEWYSRENILWQNSWLCKTPFIGYMEMRPAPLYVFVGRLDIGT